MRVISEFLFSGEMADLPAKARSLQTDRFYGGCMASRVTSYYWQGKGNDAMGAVSDEVQRIFVRRN